MQTTLRRHLLLFKKNTSQLALALLILPLNQPDQWHSFKFSTVDANKITHLERGLQIQVNSSASPLLFPFKQPKKITSLAVKAHFTGDIPNIPKNSLQGHPRWDDFVLRIGLILKGKNKLNWFDRQFSPDWLINMEKLLPNDFGIKEVHFYTTCQQDKLLNQKRTHIMDHHLKETCVFKINSDPHIHWNHKIENPQTILGIWISSDGDQTKAKFKLTIEELKLNYM